MNDGIAHRLHQVGCDVLQRVNAIDACYAAHGSFEQLFA
jgi:hypothetical protein